MAQMQRARTQLEQKQIQKIIEKCPFPKSMSVQYTNWILNEIDKLDKRRKNERINY